MNTIYLLLTTVILIGCSPSDIGELGNEYGITEQYPEVEQGNSIIKGTLLSSIVLDDEIESLPIMLAFESGGRILAYAEHYGRFGVVIKPIGLVCGTAKKDIKNDLSVVYFDGRFGKKEFDFQVYSDEMSNKCDSN